jgi:eukaryotic-like serine/threonine-protein kinase
MGPTNRDDMTREPPDDDTIDDNDDDRAPLEAIAAEFVERMRHGESPTIEAYAARHPDIADEIRDLLPTVLAMEQLKLQKEQPEKSRFLKGPKSLKKLGDYLILGEIGRGGMGIVYEAEQQSLGRYVAVKVLPRQSLLDAHRLERFEREAQTAARLHHTNIVPIFGVGEQDGYHYYVMQLIRGLGLDRVVRELRGEKPRTSIGTSNTSIHAMARDAASGLCLGEFPSPSSSTSVDSSPSHPAANGDADEPDARESSRAVGLAYWHSVARVGQQVADALSYAHSQGTLHRDIKPANLLLDGQGVVWVTDFGLAKAIEESNITHTGDVVGTLQYMAPEQFHGQYDARTDIYCLGLTLYELLTLQPAFSGSNRTGLMHQVTEGRTASPSRIRPGIPTDLETVVLKAINREPDHRYQTADELREDLQRFLADEPILARRTTPIQHLARWCRRNKSLASAIAVAILTVMGSAALGWTNYVNEAAISEELRDAKRLAQSNLSRSLKAFGGVFDHLAGPDVFQVVIRDATTTESADEADETGTTYQDISIPFPSKKDAALLQKILEVFGQFEAENQSHPELLQDTARANQRIGDIRMRLGELDQARQSYTNAIRIYQHVDAGRYLVEVAAIRNQLGQVYAQQGVIAKARRSHTLVLRVLEDQAGEPKTTTHRGLYELARAHDFLGSWGTPTLEDRRIESRRPRERRRGEGRRRAVVSRLRPGRPSGRGKSRGANRRVHHVRAQKILADLLEAEPNKVAFRLAQARSCRNYYGYIWRGRLRHLRDHQDEFLARFLISEATTILETLVNEFPDAPLYRYELAETLIAGRSSRDDTTRLDRALTIARRLQVDFPTAPAYIALTSRILQHLGTNHHRQRSNLEEPALIESISLLEDLVRRWPENGPYLEQLSSARRPLVNLLFRSQRKPDDALLQAEKMIHEREQAFAMMKRPDRAYLRVASNHRLYAEVLRSLGRTEDARNASAEAQAARSKAGVIGRRR